MGLILRQKLIASNLFTRPASDQLSCINFNFSSFPFFFFLSLAPLLLRAEEQTVNDVDEGNAISFKE